VATFGGASDYVILRGGLAVPMAPIRLLLDLERRGFRLEREDDALVVEPGQLLSDEDCASIRHWKRHLLALIAYQADEHPPVTDPVTPRPTAGQPPDHTLRTAHLSEDLGGSESDPPRRQADPRRDLAAAPVPDARDSAWFRFVCEVQDLRSNGGATWAEETLRRLQATVEHTRDVTPRQRQTLERIQQSPWSPARLWDVTGRYRRWH